LGSSKKCCFIKSKNHERILTSILDLQVVKLLREAYDRVKALLKKVCLIILLSISFFFGKPFSFSFGFGRVFKRNISLAEEIINGLEDN